MEKTAIILVRPRIPENIGACCRAMKNMGLSRLVLVAPVDLDADRVRKTATHVAVDIMDRAQVCDRLEEALAPFSFIAGTTARRGRQRRMVVSPAGLAEKVSVLPQKNRAAILFGPEDRGLENDDLRYCHCLVHIPTADFSSLNLAQAVMVICYELRKAKNPPEASFVPRLATSFELEGMYAHMKEVLLAIDFIDRQNPDYWLNNFRRFFARIGLTAREVRLIRGLCRQVNWYGNKRYADGLADAAEKSPDTDKTGKQGASE